MKIYSELDLNTFDAWSGGEITLEHVKDAGKADALEAILDDIYPDGMDKTELNDLLRFDSDAVYEWLDIRTDDDIQEEIDACHEHLEDIEQEIEDEIEDYAADYDMEVEDIPQAEIEAIRASYEDERKDVQEEIDELLEELENWNGIEFGNDD